VVTPVTSAWTTKNETGRISPGKQRCSSQNFFLS